jgi:hypothetical protein
MYTIPDSKEHLRTVIIDKSVIAEKAKPQVKIEKATKDKDSKKTKKLDEKPTHNNKEDHLKHAD